MTSGDMRKGEDGTFERIGEDVGGMAGRTAGQATDMAMNAVGTVMSAAVEVLGDWWSSDSARQASSRFGESHDRNCREHFESRSSENRTYDATRPLYQFGHLAGQNPDYQGRSFDQVEPDLKRVWKSDQASQFGEWPEVRGYVGFGFEGAERAEPLS